MIAFLNPNVLLLLLLVVPISLFLRQQETVYQKRLAIISHNSINVASARQRLIRLLLWIICCVFIVVALSRPVWGTEIEIVETQGVSVMLVLDVSTSMDSEDVLPSRLERAKVSLGELIQQLKGNEVGLVLFAGQAVVQFPLTSDTLSAVEAVKNISTHSLASQGTNIADALRLAILSFDAASKGQHIIVLLTDGESHDGNLDSVINDTVRANVAIYTVGYGSTEGVTIPIRNPDGSIIDKADSAGNQVVSALDEATLQRIANTTGGIYQRVGTAGEEVSALMQFLDQYLPQTLDRGVQTKPIERFDIFLVLAVILLTTEIVFSTSKRHSALI